MMGTYIICERIENPLFSWDVQPSLIFKTGSVLFISPAFHVFAQALHGSGLNHRLHHHQWGAVQKDVDDHTSQSAYAT